MTKFFSCLNRVLFLVNGMETNHLNVSLSYTCLLVVIEVGIKANTYACLCDSALIMMPLRMLDRGNVHIHADQWRWTLDSV